MPYVAPTKPTAGEATRKALVDLIIDDLASQQSAIQGIVAAGVPNGSFEINGDGNLEHPDGWSLVKYSGGAGGIVSSKLGEPNYVAGSSAHGKSGFRFVHPGGATFGGGYLEQEDYFEVSPERELLLQWQHKCSVAGMRDKVEIRFFDSSQIFLSSVTLYNSTANPTNWIVQSASATVPATAAYAKIRITGGDPATTTGGSSYWDDFVLLQNDSRAPRNLTAYTASGTFICPKHINRVRVRAWGAGGGGGGGQGGVNGGGGGGGGAYAEGIVAVVPDTAYTVTVGVAGNGGAANANGTAGGSSSVGSLISAAGGAGGQRPADGGAGGAGGAAGSADFAIAGGTGQGMSSSGGLGGCAGLGGIGGGLVRTAAMTPGGGGLGATLAGLAGNDGANGRVVIEY